MWQVLMKVLGAPGPRPAAQREEPDRDSDAALWSERRRPLRASDLRLTVAARRWLDAMPAHARPVLLTARHPRIVNRLAALRGEPAVALEWLDTLLIDERGGRTGFVPMIRAEIVRLGYLYHALYKPLYRARLHDAPDARADDKPSHGDPSAWADPPPAPRLGREFAAAQRLIRFVPDRSA